MIWDPIKISPQYNTNEILYYSMPFTITGSRESWNDDSGRVLPPGATQMYVVPLI